MTKSCEIIKDISISQLRACKLLSQMEKGALPPVIFLSVTNKTIDKNALSKALIFLIKRHESLRTKFIKIDGEIKQVIVPYTKNILDLQYFDLSISPNCDEAISIICTENHKKFLNIHEAPLIKTILFKIDNNRFHFYFLIHHIISDGWSSEILKKELSLFYATYRKNIEPTPPFLSFQLRHYTSKQNAFYHKNKGIFFDYWRKKLGELPNSIDLRRYTHPLNKKNINKSYFKSIGTFVRKLHNNKGGAFVLNIENEEFNSIKNLVKITRSSIGPIIYYSLFLLLHYITAKEKILLILPIADRFTSETKSVIGCLLGEIYLYKKVDENDSFKNGIIDLYFDMIKSCRHIVFDPDYCGLDEEALRSNCDLYINFQKNHINIDKIYNVGHQSENGSYYPLACTINEYADGLSLRWQYDLDLFNPTFIEYISQTHKKILSCICEKPDRNFSHLSQYV